jgi:hypothetical protein
MKNTIIKVSKPILDSIQEKRFKRNLEILHICIVDYVDDKLILHGPYLSFQLLFELYFENKFSSFIAFITFCSTK